MQQSPLEEEFVALSYDEIGRALQILGTSFIDDLRTIPKQHIFATLEHDHPASAIRAAITRARCRGGAAGPVRVEAPDRREDAYR